MRVLQFVPTLGYGGVARMVLNYYRALKPKGFAFDFVTHGGVEVFHSDLISSGSRIFYVQPIHEVGLPTYMLRLRRLSLSSYDVVHVHTGHLTGFYSGMIRLTGQSRIVAHAHASRSVKPEHESFMPMLRRLAVVNSRARLACGQNAGDYCFGAGNYAILPNGLDLDSALAAAGTDPRQVRAQLRIGSERFLVGHVGRFTYEKNHALVLEAFKRLLRQDPRAFLVLVGDGPLRGQMEALAGTLGVSDSVLFAGARDDVYEIMRCLDVLLLPSLFEGMPMVVIEAQAVGTHCIVSDVVDRGVDLGLGLVQFLPIESAEEWSTAIADLASTVPERLSADEVRRRFEETGYDLRDSAEALARVYREVAGR